MKKCLWSDIISKLNLDQGVEFTIEGDTTNVYKFVSNGLFYRNKIDVVHHPAEQALFRILGGNVEITLLPFVPKIDHHYYTYEYDSQHYTWCIIRKTWEGTTFDYYALKCGCVFQTSQMALYKFYDKYKELTGCNYVLPNGIDEIIVKE